MENLASDSVIMDEVLEETSIAHSYKSWYHRPR